MHALCVNATAAVHFLLVGIASLLAVVVIHVMLCCRYWYGLDSHI